MKKMLITPVAVIAAAALVASATAGSARPAKSAKLTIVHVQKGCHVFSDTAGKTAALNVAIARGGSITILNQDIDGHKLVESAGPSKLALQALRMNDDAVLTFAKAGVYRFSTKTFELKGMPPVKTMGMDNALRLTVVVS